LGHVLAQLGQYEEEAAATLGASRWTTFWRITLPNVRHGLLFGVTMTAARSLGEFGAVLVIGGAISGKTQTATTLIYSSLEERHPSTAFGMALVLCGLSATVVLAMKALQRRSGLPQ
jgi:sulfate transport system permease protein